MSGTGTLATSTATPPSLAAVAASAAAAAVAALHEQRQLLNNGNSTTNTFESSMNMFRHLPTGKAKFVITADQKDAAAWRACLCNERQFKRILLNMLQKLFNFCDYHLDETNTCRYSVNIGPLVENSVNVDVFFDSTYIMELLQYFTHMPNFDHCLFDWSAIPVFTSESITPKIAHLIFKHAFMESAALVPIFHLEMVAVKPSPRK